MRSFIVPPPWLCGWRIIATGARGRGAGAKRPSRRPSGPGKITEGMWLALFGARTRDWRPESAGLYSDDATFRNSRAMSRIYLDHAATTPLRPEAREAMLRGFELWANPSSPHAEGRAARAALADARQRVKVALKWDGEVIFTSGASEAAAIAFGAAKAGEWLVSAVEHESILKGAPGASVLPVGGDGALDMETLERELAAAGNPLVAVQTINSETGENQDFCAVSELVEKAGGLYLIDASQSAGKYPFRYQADM